MKYTDADMECNMKQFYLYAIRTLHFAALGAHSEQMRRAKKEVTFSDLSVTQANRINSAQAPHTKDTIFTVLGNAIVVQDDELAGALKQLPERKCNILLLKYFLKWSDRKIGEAFGSYRTTINYQRHAALKTLRTIYGGETKWG